MKYNKIILISIDALSKEYQSLFEPYFSTVYQNYYSTNTWTLPAHFTMLSALQIPELFYQMKLKEIEKYEGYVKGIPTLGYMLKQLGFKTRAFTGGGFMSKYFGWGYDWDEWKEASNEEEEWKGEPVLPQKQEFLFLHTYYVHNWFNESKRLRKIFWEIRRKLDEGENVDKEKFTWLLKTGKKTYKKRVIEIAEKLKWIKDLDANTLVILTSDHSELFFDIDEGFHHGNFALKNFSIYKVPLLIKEKKLNKTSKSIIKENLYDFLLPKIIFDKLGKDFTSSFRKLMSISQMDELNKLKKQLDDLSKELNLTREALYKIQSSKTYKLWQAYCRIRDKLFSVLKNEEREK